jgi:hypothetical protein
MQPAVHQPLHGAFNLISDVIGAKLVEACFMRYHAMQRNKSRLKVCALTLLAALGAPLLASAADNPASNGQVISGTWEHRHVTFSYYGITSLYSCSGLETNIGSLLRHLGARKDVKVNARGCPHGYDAPSRNAIIDLDFYTLVPSSDATAADVVQAHWAPVVVNSSHPYFMGRGDCELIDEMKDVISKNFSFQDLKYRADCVPHEVNIDDFGIKAQVLRALPAASATRS